MKTATRLASLIALGIALTFGNNVRGDSSFLKSIKNPATREQLKSFVAAKEAQANAATNTMPEEFKAFFAAAQKGDWMAVSNIFENLRDNGGSAPKNPEWHGTQWETVREIWGAFAAFEYGDEKYSVLFGNDIIQSIPPGSIYFGGTDEGRFIVTALQTSQIKGAPFFTLTQNAQADGTYLDYLRSMYGTKIYIPTAGDVSACYQEYGEDGAKRLKKHRLDPGENISMGKDGRIQVGGAVAVMKINGLITKVVFDRNTNREFYVEESFPLDWMYSYLEPHGLIFKLNHKPLNKLSNEAIQRDHAYWTKTVSPMIGDWLHDDASVTNIVAFAERVFLRHDFAGFNGGPAFVENAYAHRMFSKERAEIADLYAWRAKHSNHAAEKNRMERETDFAFRQAWALCPDSPEVLFRYVAFLMDNSRLTDAVTLARTCLKLNPNNDSVSNLVANLEQYKKQSDDWVKYQRRVSAMENEAKVNPANYSNIFLLAAYYLQEQATNRADELMRKAVDRPRVPAMVLYSDAKFFAQVDDLSGLEATLKKLTIMEPDAPEIWYDLARVEATLKKNRKAIECLRTAIRLSDQQLKTNPKAFDVRSTACTNRVDFSTIRESANFQKLVMP